MRCYVALAILVGVLVAGCAAKHWTKPGATTQDFVRDSEACELEARRGVFTGPPVNKRKYRSCMMARGYERVVGGQWVGARD